MNSTLRRVGVALAAVAAAMALGVGALMGAMVWGPGIADQLQRVRFDSVAWRDTIRAYSPEHPVRIRMVDDLLRHHRLEGMSRAEVVALLGEPRPTKYFSEYDLVYWLGPERGLFSIDSEWLVLKLDARDRVVAHHVLTD